MEENNISNLTSQQMEQVNNQLQATMMSAKLFGDEDLVTRCSRAILAFNSNILDHNPTFEEMLDELAHNTGNENEATLEEKSVESKATEIVSTENNASIVSGSDFGSAMASLFGAFAQAKAQGVEGADEAMGAFVNSMSQSNLSPENKEMEETKE